MWIFRFSAVRSMSFTHLCSSSAWHVWWINEFMHLLVLTWGPKLNHTGVGWSPLRVQSSRNGARDRPRETLCSRDELKGLNSRAWRKKSCCDLCRKFKPPPAWGRGAGGEQLDSGGQMVWRGVEEGVGGQVGGRRWGWDVVLGTSRLPASV